MKQINVAAAFSLATIGNAFAGPASDVAQTHFKAIGDGDMQIIMRGYGTDPHLNWVGGSLDGKYTGSDAVRGHGRSSPSRKGR